MRSRSEPERSPDGLGGRFLGGAGRWRVGGLILVGFNAPPCGTANERLLDGARRRRELKGLGLATRRRSDDGTLLRALPLHFGGYVALQACGEAVWTAGADGLVHVVGVTQGGAAGPAAS